MRIIDNITETVRDDMEKSIIKGSRVSIAAACFSMYAYNELKKQLESVDELRFIFTSPTFVTEQAEAMIAKKESVFNANEIVAIASQFAGKGYLEYLVDDDAEKMYEQSDKSLTLDEFKERLISYNATALSMKALMPVVPHKE